MPLLTMPAPTSARSWRTLLGCAVMAAAVTAPCAIDFPAATLHGKAAYARGGDASGVGASDAGAEGTAGGSGAAAGAGGVDSGGGADPSDGGPGGGNGGVGQNQNEAPPVADPLGRSGASLSRSQEQDLINRGWPR
jgi:hypothetical protein